LNPSASPRHNDLPWQLLKLFNNQLQDQRANLTTLTDTHTNIPKLKAGFVGGQVRPFCLAHSLHGSTQHLPRGQVALLGVACLVPPIPTPTHTQGTASGATQEQGTATWATLVLQEVLGTRPKFLGSIGQGLSLTPVWQIQSNSKEQRKEIYHTT
jgi:hypothetical protein